MTPEAWTGDERRSIPIHVLEHMDKRLALYEHTMRTLVSDHTRDEMERYKEILNRIEQNRVASETRHTDITNMFHENTQAVEKMLQAILDGFPKDKDGKPDLSGHADDHKFRMEEAKEAREFRAYVKKVIAAGVLLALVMWVGPVLLKAVVSYAS